MLNNPLERLLDEGNARRLIAFAIAASSLIVLLYSISYLPIRSALLVVIAFPVLIWIVIYFLRKRFERIVFAWLVLFPFCYNFFSFPRERSVFTVDRALLLLVMLTVISSRRHYKYLQLPPGIRLAAFLWGAYLCVCLLSLFSHPVLDMLGSYRLILDGILMPALLGLYAIKFFPVTGNLKLLHACVCILMLSIAIVTGIELLSGTNLLPWPGAVDEWVRTSDFKIIRVDGPFENSSVLCLIGTFGFFFIIYCRHLIGRELTRSGRLLNLFGASASLASALMPMNRGLVIALLMCAGLDYFSRKPLVARSTWNTLVTLLLFLALSAKLFYPEVYADRVTRGDNVYQRIAQNQQTLEVIRDHPLLGVGLNRYHDTVLGDPRYAVGWRGFEAMDVPHSSLLTVLAEEGSVGFLLYVAAQLALLRSMWQIRGVNQLGWRVFLYCILVYTIFGLDAGVAYYSDLNLFYMFVLGVVFQIQERMVRREPSSDELG